MKDLDTYFEVDLYNNKGEKTLFGKIGTGAGSYTANGYKLQTDGQFPKRFTIRSATPAESPVKITYRYSRPIKNWHKVIVPDAGRYFITSPHMVNYWSATQQSTVSDIKLPITILTGQNMRTSLAFGVLGDNVETRFRALDFMSDLGTLSVYNRRFTMQIERGFDDLLLPADMITRLGDGSITEYIYLKSDGANWVETLRDFARYQRELFNVAPTVHLPSLEPLWCSWTDWNSEDVDEKVILDSVSEGVKLGITNYILDDGWFGYGLDTRDHPNTLGDYYPETNRFPDLRKLSDTVRSLGGKLILWVGPHCVAKETKALQQAAELLIVDKNGELSWNNKYYSICMMAPSGRRYMVDIIKRIILDYDVDGIKMDLFNGIMAKTCTSTKHIHDTNSLIRGLERLLKEIHEACTELKPDFIIELKQNYATPFLSRYGTLIRAGDTPYNNEGNFMRTAFIQAYTDSAENDYMTITDNDTAIETAIIVIKMIAVGVPTYSNNFATMPQTHKNILKHYHKWYKQRIPVYRGHRTAIDTELCVWQAGEVSNTTYFLVNNGQVIDIGDEDVFEILNGTERDHVFIRYRGDAEFSVTMFDMFGDDSGKYRRQGHDSLRLPVPPGGRMIVKR